MDDTNELHGDTAPDRGEPDAEENATDASRSRNRGERASAARRRLTRFAVMGGVFAIAAAIVLPNVPREQHVRLHLGSGSSRVVSATVRVAKVEGRQGAAWDRETTWSFPNGAPPSIAWSFELPNGAADVEVELSSAGELVAKTSRVELGGDEARVELADAMRGLE